MILIQIHDDALDPWPWFLILRKHFQIKNSNLIMILIHYHDPNSWSRYGFVMMLWIHDHASWYLENFSEKKEKRFSNLIMILIHDHDLDSWSWYGFIMMLWIHDNDSWYLENFFKKKNSNLIVVNFFWNFSKVEFEKNLLFYCFPNFGDFLAP